MHDFLLPFLHLHLRLARHVQDHPAPVPMLEPQSTSAAGIPYLQLRATAVCARTGQRRPCATAEAGRGPAAAGPCPPAAADGEVAEPRGRPWPQTCCCRPTAANRKA